MVMYAPIAYIAQTLPDLTQTFIYREIFALERLGLDIETFSIWRPDKKGLSEESHHLVQKTCYAFPVYWPGFLWSHLFFLATRPAKYFGSARFVLRRRGDPLGNRRRILFHFCEAVYLAREMKKRRVKHVHAHFSINAASIALIASRLLDIPFSFTAHNILFRDRLLLKEKIKEARFIAAISAFTRQFLIDSVPGEKVSGKIHIVHCGLEPEKFFPSRHKPVKKVPVILFIAQLIEQKGAVYLIEACRILKEQGMVFHCVIVGDGPRKSIIEKLIRDYNLGDIVHMKGSVLQEHIQGHLGQADIFALPCIRTPSNDMDGIPVALMEAMAMEIPVVSTYISGIPELIENEKDGLLVEEKKPSAFAGALKKLLLDSDLRMQLGKKGREKVLKEFDIDKNARLLKNLFQNCVDYNE